MTTVRITDAGGNKPSFTQWDVDRILYVSGVASQPCLHFANAELRRAIVVEATDDNGRWKCLVPNFILQFALPVIVSVFTQPEGGEGRTEATVVIGVQPKKKPQDYTYEENIGYINWVEKSAEVQDLIDTIQGMLDSGELKGDPFTYDDFTEEQLAALKGDPGDDGVSPTVSTEVTYYGNKVTFTDADGDHTINVLDGMTATVKTALLNLFQHVAYVDDQGQTYYDALYDAFNPVLNVDYITVVFDPGTAVIYNTYELAQLRPYITCTAHYDDGTSAEVDTYTLSGTLAAGTDTITVTYGGKSAIFTVTVAEWLVSIDAVFTQGSAVIYDTDSLDTLKQYLVVTATYSDSTTAVVTDYTLSGTLAEGTSTITASYGGKTDTFNVTVTAVVYLFNNGDECTSLTGGWNTKGFNTTDTTPAIVENDGECLYITFTTSPPKAIARSLSTVNAVDFSNYSKLCVRVSMLKTAGRGGAFVYWPLAANFNEASTQTGAYGSDYATNRSTGIYNSNGAFVDKEYDISSFSGNRNISINYNPYNDGSDVTPPGAYVKVSEMYLKP